MNAKFTRGLVIAIILAVTTIIVIMVLWGYTEPSREKRICQFCGGKATMVRKPVQYKIEQRKNYDLDPTFAELQIVHCCDECKATAGGFRTTVWHKLK